MSMGELNKMLLFIFNAKFIGLYFPRMSQGIVLAAKKSKSKDNKKSAAAKKAAATRKANAAKKSAAAKKAAAAKKKATALAKKGIIKAPKSVSDMLSRIEKNKR